MIFFLFIIIILFINNNNNDDDDNNKILLLNIIRVESVHIYFIIFYNFLKKKKVFINLICISRIFIMKHFFYNSISN